MNLETVTAIYSGNMRIGYGIIIAVLAYISSWFMTCSLACAGKKERPNRARCFASLTVYAAASPALAAFFGRLIHWYSHYESYGSFSKAFAGVEGRYHEAGIIFGFIISAFLCALISGRKFRRKMMGACASGQMLFMTLVSLVSMFSDSDRGKAVMTDPAYQGLPFSYITYLSDGSSQYRTAVFFWKFMLLGVITLISLILYFRGRSAIETYVCYFAAMALLDSARYDASFLRSNGFVSLMQIVSGVFLIITFIVCTVLSARALGFHVYHVLFIMAFLSGLSLTGYMEYYVQRHGDLYPYCYSIMAAACLIMILPVITVHRKCYKKTLKGDNNK
ncbi:MAG: hypothetical protein K6F65_04915 [Lachnospiraceae bacterium]|nr:hypothetical protein [Lachnospiraceae bacterium]